MIHQGAAEKGDIHRAERGFIDEIFIIRNTPLLNYLDIAMIEQTVRKNTIERKLSFSNRPSLERTVSYHYPSTSSNVSPQKMRRKKSNLPSFEEIIRTESTMRISLTPTVAL
ncbi:hypothetical protein K7432_010226 [Basidiobolus ranarum]|uniref:Uncharacterized protein n=1 Tax=Basidiobolus ranarum TaxID=34480 RepID=A0ABR2WP35_9FUNG